MIATTGTMTPTSILAVALSTCRFSSEVDGFAAEASDMGLLIEPFAVGSLNALLVTLEPEDWFEGCDVIEELVKVQKPRSGGFPF